MPADTTPRDARAASRPSYALYSPGQICVASMFGTVLPATMLTAVNMRRLGHPRLAFTTTLLGLTAILFDALCAVRYAAPAMAGLVVAAAFIYQAPRDGSLFDAHIAAGGKRASSGGAIAAAALGLVIRIVTSMIALGR